MIKKAKKMSILIVLTIAVIVVEGRNSYHSFAGALPKPPQEVSLGQIFVKEGVSFNYPKEWIPWSDEKLLQAKNLIRQESGMDVDLIGILNTRDEQFYIQVIRQINKSSFDTFYKEKKQVADEVNTKGMVLMGKSFAKYVINKTGFSGIKESIYSYAEDINGQTGISYQFLRNGYEYNFNFIYKDSSSATKGKHIEEQVMNSVQISK
jgi:hypothetical protein